MAQSNLWDINPSPDHTSDVENPSPAAPPNNNRARCNSFSTKKAVKLALGLTAVAGVVALGAVLGLKSSSSDKPELIQASSLAENNKQGLFTSSDPLETKVKMVPSSITNVYETCFDLEKDIREALKIYIANYISSEAETNEVYAKCDPEIEDWYWEYYVGDYYYYYDNESATPNETATKKQAPISSMKQTRSGLSIKKQTRSSNQNDRTKHVNEIKNKKTSRSKGNGGAKGSGFEQNSHNDNVNERDDVVSDGSFIYAAYGDVIQVWSAHGTTEGVSITQMPGNVKDCDWNTTEPCTSSSKPIIEALFLGNGRLTAVIKQYEYDYGVSETNRPEPIIRSTNKLAVVVYDVSTVALGSPLNELAYEELSGSFLNGGSIGNGDKTVIVTSSLINSWVVTEKFSRSEPQYCGLNTTAYIELARSTAESQIALLAKQMVTELKLVNDCSGIVQVSTMQDGSIDNAPELTALDFLLGSFIQVFTLDVSSADGDIPASVAGTFSPTYDYNLYLTDDFIALPLNIYNSANDSSDYSVFVLGFSLSGDGDFKPSSYAQVPGEMYLNYRMDEKDGYLRILTSDDISKIYVLELPSTPGPMKLVGQTKLFGEDGSYFVSSSRYSGDLVFLSGSDNKNENQLPFVVVDLSDPSSPKTVGSLQVDFSLSYLQEIEVNDASYILGIGEADSSYDSIVIALIDISTPSEPRLVAHHKSESGSDTGARYDFLSIRYFEGSLTIPVSTEKYNETADEYTNTDVFVVFDISESTITPAFNVTHSTDLNYCHYDAAVPSRSFVINSELTTIKGHTAIRTDMAGNVLSELDLDNGFNYSVCPDWYYYDYGYTYNDETDDPTEAND